MARIFEFVERVLFKNYKDCMNVRYVYSSNKRFLYFIFNTIIVSSHMYPENPERTQVIVGSMNMGYVSDSDRTRIRNLFRLKCMPIPLDHSDRPVIECICN